MTETVKTFGNPPVVVEDVVDADGNTYCQVHPTLETALRCNRCERLICAKCAVRTPVGYRCRECVRVQDNTFFNADGADYGKLLAVGVALGALGAFIASYLGMLFSLLFSTFAIGIITEAALTVNKRKRGRYMGETLAIGIVIAALGVLYWQWASIPIPAALAQLPPEQAQAILQQLRPSFVGYVFSQLGVIIYTIVVVVGVIGRFSLRHR
ncbi:MAG: B-box zinc finger protein [Phototrophicaceae bacterium]